MYRPSRFASMGRVRINEQIAVSQSRAHTDNDVERSPGSRLRPRSPARLISGDPQQRQDNQSPET